MDLGRTKNPAKKNDSKSLPKILWGKNQNLSDRN